MEERIQAVQRMQDYIAAHPDESITPAELAAASYFSPWYACRIFKEQTGFSPADYMRRMKLSRSALRLRSENCRVTDAAFDAGFGSVDGYQRAFLREFGCNPREYALHPVPINLFIPYGVKFREMMKEAKTVEEAKSVFVQIIEKPERKVVIKRGVKADEYMSYCREVGCDVWGLLTSMPYMVGEPVCMWLPKKYIEPGTSEYVQGVETPMDFAGEVPDGFDVLTLPAAKFLMFQGEPFEEEDYVEAIGGVQAAIKKYDPSVIGFAWDAENPHIQLEPRGARGYIELLAVREME